MPLHMIFWSAQPQVGWLNPVTMDYASSPSGADRPWPDRSPIDPNSDDWGKHELIVWSVSGVCGQRRANPRGARRRRRTCGGPKRRREEKIMGWMWRHEKEKSLEVWFQLASDWRLLTWGQKQREKVGGRYEELEECGYIMLKLGYCFGSIIMWMTEAIMHTDTTERVILLESPWGMASSWCDARRCSPSSWLSRPTQMTFCRRDCLKRCEMWENKKILGNGEEGAMRESHLTQMWLKEEHIPQLWCLCCSTCSPWLPWWEKVFFFSHSSQFVSFFVFICRQVLQLWPWSLPHLWAWLCWVAVRMRISASFFP